MRVHFKLYFSRTRAISISFSILMVLFGIVLTNCSEEEPAPPTSPEPCVCIPGTDVEIWPNRCQILYYIGPNLTDLQKKQKIASAFNEWAQHIEVSFRQTSDPNAADIKFDYRDATKSEIDQFNQGVKCQEKIDQGPIAGTNPNVKPVPITFIASVNWDGEKSSSEKSFNFYLTALHEIGHALGLKHSLDENRLMYCFSEKQTGLAQGDIDAVKKIVPGKAPRFQDNGDGTVTDNTTGLVWLKDARCIEPPTYCYEDAVIASQGLGSGQCDLGDGSSPGDWRLPSIEEWQALLSPEGWECGRPFINIPSQGTYWSSTQSPSDTLINKVIYFGDGQVYEDWNDCRGAGFGRAFAWPVR